MLGKLFGASCFFWGRSAAGCWLPCLLSACALALHDAYEFSVLREPRGGEVRTVLPGCNALV